MTRHHLHRQGLTAVATLALGLSALAAAPAHALATFGTYAAVSGVGFSIDDGGSGSFASSRAISLDNGYSAINAYGAADLAGGKLHASSFASRGPCTPNPPLSSCDGVGAASRAAMWDQVTFLQKDGGPIENISLIPVSIAIDGHLAGHGANASYRSYYGYDANYDVDALEWVSLTDGTTESLDNLFVPLTAAPMFIYIELRTDASTDGSLGTFSLADFGNTLHFNWELPEGVVAQSASGVFMTDVASAVPEPATWALMISGFALTGSALRRRRAAFSAA